MQHGICWSTTAVSTHNNRLCVRQLTKIANRKLLFRSEAGWKKPYEPQDASSASRPGTASAGTATAAAGRALTVEERQAKAKQDIAAAKARESAFASQGTRQFTDTSIAQPETPDFGSSSSRPSSVDSATDTFDLRDSSTESLEQRPSDTFKLPSDTAGSTADSATDTFQLGDGRGASEEPSPTGTFILDSDASGVSSASSQQSVDQPDTGQTQSQPLSSKGRADVKPDADDERDGKPKAQSELQGQSKQALSSQPASDQTTKRLEDPEDDTAAESLPAPVYEPDTSKPLSTTGRADLKPGAESEDDARATAQAQLQQQTFPVEKPAADTGADSKPSAAADDKPAPVYEPDTSKPRYATGRADLKPRNTDEQNARAKAEAELKQKSRQTVVPEVSAAEAVSKLKQSEPAPASTATPAATDQSAAKAKPIAGGRAPEGEHDAREQGMAKLKKESQQQQPVKEVPRTPVQEQKQPLSLQEQQPSSSQQRPLSELGQTADLAKGLAGASMSAEPVKAQAQGQASPSGERQPSPFQAQQAATSMSTAESTPATLSPSQQPQNPFQNLVSAFQDLLGGKPSPVTSPSSNLSTAQQAQIPAGDASAAQRMAASNQALAAGKGQARISRQVPVKRYSEVTLDGSVTEFVRERGLRAPLLLLAGLAASAAQTLEPLWPVTSHFL